MNSKFIGFFYISFFFLLLALILFAMAIGVSAFAGLEFRLFILFSTVVILLILLRRLMKERWIRRIVKEEREESLKEGGVEEPRPFRELTKEEGGILTFLHQTSERILSNAWWLVPLFLLLDSFGVLLFFNINPESSLGDLLSFVYAVLFTIQFILASTAAQEASRYLDLRAPVFRVQGRAIKEDLARRSGKDYYITVRRIKFSEADYNLLKDFYMKIKDGDEVAVEYSPRTKHVWKMYKTEDLK